MTDHELPANLTEEEVERARRWAEGIEANPKSWSLLTRTAARVILNAVPAPSPPTLADMTPEERAACRWMRADVAGTSKRYMIADPRDEDNDTAILFSEEGQPEWFLPEYVTPRPDLPRLTWTDTVQPALPDGWRLADHEVYGRVMVTNPTPNADGSVCYVIPADDYALGYDWHFCRPAELTYTDEEEA